MLNDQVLKERWPGLITGKLSDFAGMFLVPFLGMCVLEALCMASGRRISGRQRWLAFCTTCVVAVLCLALTKLSDPVGDAYGWLIGAARWPFVSVAEFDIRPVRAIGVVQDPTDIWAALALVPAYLLVRYRWRLRPGPGEVGHIRPAERPGRA